MKAAAGAVEVPGRRRAVVDTDRSPGDVGGVARGIHDLNADVVVGVLAELHAVERDAGGLAEGTWADRRELEWVGVARVEIATAHVTELGTCPYLAVDDDLCQVQAAALVGDVHGHGALPGEDRAAKQVPARAPRRRGGVGHGERHPVGQIFGKGSRWGGQGCLTAAKACGAQRQAGRAVEVDRVGWHRLSTRVSGGREARSPIDKGRLRPVALDGDGGNLPAAADLTSPPQPGGADAQFGPSGGHG